MSRGLETVSIDFLTPSRIKSILRRIVFCGESTDFLERMIEAKIFIDINCIFEPDRKTALIYACELNRPSIAQWLIEHGANVNMEGSQGFSAILMACFEENFEIFKMLYENGADINHSDDGGKACIHYICEYEELDALKLILGDDSVDVNVQTSYNNRPVHYSCLHESSEAFKLLIDHGAVYDCVNIHGQTPLHIAACCANLEITNQLLTLGVDVNCKDHQGQTPLHHACILRNLSMCKLLIENGADVNVYDLYSGRSLLHLAFEHPEIVKCLLKAGADVNGNNSTGYPLIYSAVKSSDLRLCRILLAHEADVNCGPLGSTMLHLSGAESTLDMVKLIYQYSPSSIDSKDYECKTPLHYACKRKYSESSEIIKFLVDNGADVDAKDNSESTPMHEACKVVDDDDQDDSLRTVKLLCRYNADINIQNSAGESPLSIAGKNNKSKVSDFLITQR